MVNGELLNGALGPVGGRVATPTLVMVMKIIKIFLDGLCVCSYSLWEQIFVADICYKRLMEIWGEAYSSYFHIFTFIIIYDFLYNLHQTVTDRFERLISLIAEARRIN